jgi:hypothetical protein
VAHELGTDVSLDLQKPAKADSSGSDGNFLTHFNIDDLPRNKTSVNVLILHPNGDVIIKTPQGQAMNTIKNLALKCWKAAANAFIADEATKPDLLIALNRSVNQELKIFCKSEIILKGKQVDQLKAFSNKILQKETEDLPFWNACIRGSCGVQLDDELERKTTNTIALASATIARHRVSDLSAYHYRISTALCYSGISFDGAVRLNRLGICMSPQQMVHLQRVIGKDHYAKALVWKKELQSNLAACSLLQEVIDKQFPPLAEDDMVVERVADLHIDTYNFYEREVMETCKSAISEAQVKLGGSPLASLSVLTEDEIWGALLILKCQNLPFYK